MTLFDLKGQSAKSAKFSATVLPVHVIRSQSEESVCQQYFITAGTPPTFVEVLKTY